MGSGNRNKVNDLREPFVVSHCHGSKAAYPFPGRVVSRYLKRKSRTGFISFRNRPEEISLVSFGVQDPVFLSSLRVRPHEKSYSPSFEGRRDLSEQNNAVYFVSVYALFEGQLEKDLELTEMIEKLKTNLIQRARKKYLITIA